MITLPLLVGGRAAVARPGGVSVFGSVIEPRELLREMRSRHMRHLSHFELRNDSPVSSVNPNLYCGKQMYAGDSSSWVYKWQVPIG